MPLTLTREQLVKLVDGIEKKLGDLRPIISSVRANKLREIQWQHAKRGWDGAGPNKASTNKARAKRHGYYKSPQGAGVRAAGPVFAWTRRFLDATSRFTHIDRDGASIDPIQNYGHSDVHRVEHVVDALEARGGSVWDFEGIDDAVAEAIRNRVAQLARGAKS